MVFLAQKIWSCNVCFTFVFEPSNARSHWIHAYIYKYIVNTLFKIQGGQVSQIKGLTKRRVQVTQEKKLVSL